MTNKQKSKQEIIPPKRGRPKGAKDKPGAKRVANKTAFGKNGGNVPGRPKADYSLRDLFRGSAQEVHDQALEWLLDDTLDNEFRLEVWDRICERGWGPPPKPIDHEEGLNGSGGGTQILIMGNDAKA